MVEIIKTIDGTYLPVIGRYIELFVYKGKLCRGFLYVGLDHNFNISIRTTSLIVCKCLDHEIIESVYKDFHKFIGKDGRFKSKYIRKFRRMLVRLNHNNYYRFINSKGLYTLKKYPKVNMVKHTILNKRQDLNKYILKVGEIGNG